MSLFTILTTIVDLAVVSALLYAALILVRKTNSIFIFKGFITLFLIYLASAFFKLKLTLLIFQFFLSFFVIIFVVIFQKELRRFLEGFSFSYLQSFFVTKKRPDHERVVGAIKRSVEHFVEKKYGALIVLPGNQPLERFLEGGFVLDGKVSVPLLVSIFDPSSPGHDGAVVIEQDKVRKFSVHLPLAENITAIKEKGTRHRAGLGLAERCDAMVIIVSEETGGISIAQDGKLKPVASVEELEEQILGFGKEIVRETNEESFSYAIMHQNIRDRIYALATALALWYIFVGRF